MIYQERIAAYKLVFALYAKLKLCVLCVYTKVICIVQWNECACRWIVKHQSIRFLSPYKSCRENHSFYWSYYEKTPHSFSKIEAFSQESWIYYFTQVLYRWVRARVYRPQKWSVKCIHWWIRTKWEHSSCIACALRVENRIQRQIYIHTHIHSPVHVHTFTPSCLRTSIFRLNTAYMWYEFVLVISFHSTAFSFLYSAPPFGQFSYILGCFSTLSSSWRHTQIYSSRSNCSKFTLFFIFHSILMLKHGQTHWFD